jgi:hypothetical protein
MPINDVFVRQTCQDDRNAARSESKGTNTVQRGGNREVEST